MTESLGILVSTDKHLDHVVNLAKAAHEKGKLVNVFFTGNGVRLTMQPAIQGTGGKGEAVRVRCQFQVQWTAWPGRRGAGRGGSRISPPRPKTPKCWPSRTVI